MRRSLSISAKSCCAKEKTRLTSVLFECDYGTGSLEERHQCYLKAAKESGKRARECMLVNS